MNTPVDQARIVILIAVSRFPLTVNIDSWWLITLTIYAWDMVYQNGLSTKVNGYVILVSISVRDGSMNAMQWAWSLTCLSRQ